MDTDDATTWMMSQENRSKLCSRIGPSVVFRSRVHNLIAFNVPLGIDPENKDHRLEICEANSLEAETITAMRWVKPIQRRSPEQRTAHLFLTFSNVDAANRAITNGLHICNRRCHLERVKREPTRCLKCQGWNHFATDCPEDDEKCGNCTKNHRTNECPTPEARCCISCNSNEHASWSRECPTFVRKQNEFNSRNPENTLQYIPTAEPWTWTTNTETTIQPPPPAANKPYHSNQDKRIPTRKSQAPARKVDSYVPRAPRIDSYIPRPRGDSYVPSYDRTGKRRPETGWDDEARPATCSLHFC